VVTVAQQPKTKNAANVQVVVSAQIAVLHLTVQRQTVKQDKQKCRLTCACQVAFLFGLEYNTQLSIVTIICKFSVL
jgi:hypothetical protein